MLRDIMMTSDDLLWTAPQRGGLNPSEWEQVVDHLVQRLGDFLRHDVRRDSNAFIADGHSGGFSVDFWSAAPVAGPLALSVRGTFGASTYEGRDAEYVGVQGWLYPYIAGQRTATTGDGHNHIFLRYAKADADDNDWEMIGCTGGSGWRMLGWSPDTYGEFGGLDIWADGPV